MPSVETPRPVGPELHKDNSLIRDRITHAKTELANLPIVKEGERILTDFRRSDKIIVEAGTGTGKSLALPIVLYDELLQNGQTGKILMTQPNRLLTSRAAKNLGEQIGEEHVGYRYKGKDTTNHQTKPIEVNVEQTLLNRLLSDKDLDGVDVVILDEVHRRNKILDVLVPLLQDTQKRRTQAGKPLKIVYTSATLDHEKMMKYLDGATHVHIEGRTFPITTYFAENPLDPNDLTTLIAKSAEKTAEIVKSGGDPGEILTFLPGRGEIEQYKKQVEQLLEGENIEVIVLTGGKEGKDNEEKIKKPTTNRRIYAVTPVAQEGITLPEVTNVIDLGLERMPVYDEESQTTTLQLVTSTKSSSRQRWGRAGRVKPGNAFPMFSESQFNARNEHLKPEMLRTDLTDLVLLMKSSEVGINDVENFPFIDPPGKERIQQAVQKLQHLGALDSDGVITKIGERMTQFDTEPHIARMLVEAERLGCLDDIAILVGILQSEKSIYDPNTKEPFKTWNTRLADPASDIITLANIWNDFLKNNQSPQSTNSWRMRTGIQTGPLYDAISLRSEILKKESDIREIHLSAEKAQKLHQCIAVGLVDNFVKKSGNQYEIPGKFSGIEISKNSVLYKTSPDSFLSGQIKKIRNGRKFASFNIPLTPEELHAIAPYLTEYVKPDNTPPSAQIPEETSYDQGSHELNDTVPVTQPENETQTHNPDPENPEAQMSQSHYTTEPEHHDDSHDTHRNSHGHGHDHNHSHDAHHHQPKGFVYDQSQSELLNTIRFLDSKALELSKKPIKFVVGKIKALLKKLKIKLPKKQETKDH